MGGPFIAEADFAFGRVDVHIDLPRVQGQQHHRDRVTPYRKQAAIRVLQAILERGVGHGTAIYEE